MTILKVLLLPVTISVVATAFPSVLGSYPRAYAGSQSQFGGAGANAIVQLGPGGLDGADTSLLGGYPGALAGGQSQWGGLGGFGSLLNGQIPVGGFGGLSGPGGSLAYAARDINPSKFIQNNDQTNNVDFGIAQNPATDNSNAISQSRRLNRLQSVFGRYPGALAGGQSQLGGLGGFGGFLNGQIPVGGFGGLSEPGGSLAYAARDTNPIKLIQNNDQTNDVDFGIAQSPVTNNQNTIGQARQLNRLQSVFGRYPGGLARGQSQLEGLGSLPNRPIQFGGFGGFSGLGGSLLPAARGQSQQLPSSLSGSDMFGGLGGSGRTSSESSYEAESSVSQFKQSSSYQESNGPYGAIGTKTSSPFTGPTGGANILIGSGGPVSPVPTPLPFVPGRQGGFGAFGGLVSPAPAPRPFLPGGLISSGGLGGLLRPPSPVIGGLTEIGGSYPVEQNQVVIAAPSAPSANNGPSGIGGSGQFILPGPTAGPLNGGALNYGGPGEFIMPGPSGGPAINDQGGISGAFGYGGPGGFIIPGPSVGPAISGQAAIDGTPGFAIGGLAGNGVIQPGPILIPGPDNNRPGELMFPGPSAGPAFINGPGLTGGASDITVPSGFVNPAPPSAPIVIDGQDGFINSVPSSGPLEVDGQVGTGGLSGFGRASGIFGGGLGGLTGLPIGQILIGNQGGRPGIGGLNGYINSAVPARPFVLGGQGGFANQLPSWGQFGPGGEDMSGGLGGFVSPSLPNGPVRLTNQGGTGIASNIGGPGELINPAPPTASTSISGQEGIAQARVVSGGFINSPSFSGPYVPGGQSGLAGLNGLMNPISRPITLPGFDGIEGAGRSGALGGLIGSGGFNGAGGYGWWGGNGGPSVPGGLNGLISPGGSGGLNEFISPGGSGELNGFISPGGSGGLNRFISPGGSGGLNGFISPGGSGGISGINWSNLLGGGLNGLGGSDGVQASVALPGFGGSGGLGGLVSAGNIDQSLLNQVQGSSGPAAAASANPGSAGAVVSLGGSGRAVGGYPGFRQLRENKESDADTQPLLKRSNIPSEGEDALESEPENRNA